VSQDPLWYKDAVFYELHVKAFHDSNGDGIGDFNGLIQQLAVDRYLENSATRIAAIPTQSSPAITTSFTRA